MQGQDQRLRGKTGCNDFVSPFVIKGEDVRFTFPLGTKMFCEGRMKYEDAMEEILPQIRKVKLSREEMVFLSEDKKSF